MPNEVLTTRLRRNPEKKFNAHHVRIRIGENFRAKLSAIVVY